MCGTHCRISRSDNRHSMRSVGRVQLVGSYSYIDGLKDHILPWDSTPALAMVPLLFVLIVQAEAMT